MTELPPFIARLLRGKRASASQLSPQMSRRLRPLFDATILDREISGRGEIVVVRDITALERWIAREYPAAGGRWQVAESHARARAIALRRSSKSGTHGVVRGILHLRSPADPLLDIAIDGADLPVGPLTRRHGLAATLINDASRLQTETRLALIENLELFLQAESVLPDRPLMLHSAGAISDRLIGCLARSSFPSPLLHLPDYDPVGLRDYLRLRQMLGDRVSLFVPTDLEERFDQFGDRDLLTKKPRNRSLLAKLAHVTWPCPESARVFALVKSTGCGLEQECLLLEPAEAAPEPRSIQNIGEQNHTLP